MEEYWMKVDQAIVNQGITKTKLINLLQVESSTFYHWRKKNVMPPDDILQKLSKLIGVSSQNQPVKMIPFYDAIAVGGSSMLSESDTPYNKPTEMINPGTWFKTANGSLRVYGHSMFPKYPSGSIIAFKNGTDLTIIHYGEDYVIELEDRRIVKRVQKSKEKESIQVNSYNNMKDDSGSMVYAPYDIPLKAIKRMYMVLGKIELEASI